MFRRFDGIDAAFRLVLHVILVKISKGVLKHSIFIFIIVLITKLIISFIFFREWISIFLHVFTCFDLIMFGSFWSSIFRVVIIAPFMQFGLFPQPILKYNVYLDLFSFQYRFQSNAKHTIWLHRSRRHDITWTPNFFILIIVCNSIWLKCITYIV